ncbi:MAG: HIT family protein [Patescibacteria group bacterium]
MTNNCEFCDKNIDKQEIFRTDYMKVLCPHRPVIDKHLIIMPINHIETFDQLSGKELLDCLFVIKKIKDAFIGSYKMTGYNLIINNGKKAGQKISHSHIHFFPRFNNEAMSPFKAMENSNREILSDQEIINKVNGLKKDINL